MSPIFNHNCFPHYPGITPKAAITFEPCNNTAYRTQILRAKPYCLSFYINHRSYNFFNPCYKDCKLESCYLLL